MDLLQWLNSGGGALRIVALSVGGIALAVALFTPVSPLALSRADVAVGRGEPSTAVLQYDAIAAYNLIPQHRESALWRSAVVFAVDLADPEGSRVRLVRLLSRFPDSPNASAAWELLGDVTLANGGQLGDAGLAYGHAFRVAPNDEHADERLVASARSFADARQYRRASWAWTKLADTFPEHRALSLIGLAEIAMLRSDVVGALALYEQAIPHANNDDVRVIARFGASSCLERLGDLDEALAELDVADVPDSVREQRRRGMIDRRFQREGGSRQD